MGGKVSVGLIELIVEMLLEDPETPALDIYVEITEIGVPCSYTYVKQSRSLIRTVLLELQQRGLLTRKVMLDKEEDAGTQAETIQGPSAPRQGN